MATITPPRILESYVCGEWTRGARDGVPLLNATMY